ncbi:MAG: PKD domain-containing protein, partial [Thermoplasmatota archaeon]
EDDTQNCAIGNDHVSCTYRVPLVVAASPKNMKQAYISHVAYNTTNVIALAERVANNVDPGVITSDGSLGKSTFPLNVNDSKALGDPLEDIWIHGAGTPLHASATAAPTLGNAPLAVNFTGSATGGSAPYTWSWTFGDGATSTAQNPTHTYSTHGNRTATLTVTDAKATKATASVNVKVDDSTDALESRASADTTSGQVPLTVHFTGLAGGGTTPYTWNWTFGDGSSSNLENPAYTYNTPATYTANLTVTDAHGTSVKHSLTITASPSGGTSPEPTATANPTSGSAPLAVNFTGSAVGGIPPYSWLWDFKDGSTSTLQNPSHTFQSAGTYAVELTATDSGSAQGFTNVTVTVTSSGGGTPKTFFTDAMENGKNGWTTVRNSGTGTSSWQQVTTQANSPTHSWTCGGGTSYAANSNCDLISPAIDLTNATAAHFTWFNKIGGDAGDTGQVLVSSDDNKTYTSIVSGLQGITSWTNETYDLSQYAGVLGASKVRLKFHFVSDGSGNANAWFVDDVKVWGTQGTPATVPGAPTGLTATAGNAQVSLSWTAPSSNGGAAITNYKIYRGTSAGGESLYSATGGANTSYVDKKATNGQTYYYEATAVNSAGEGAKSNEASATPSSGNTAPGAPTGLTATGGVKQVSLSWTAPSSTGGSDITNYKIYRGTTSGSETFLGATGGTNTSYVDKNVATNTTYFYQVSAVNSVGEGAKSSEASATTAGVPYPPSGLAATAGNAQVSLAWSAPANTGGSAITNYQIYRGTSAGGETSYSQTGGANTSYVDTKATNGQIYYYKVSAVNSVGEGALSNEASATPVACSGNGPSNDCFANPITVSSVPYSNTEATTGATTETGEPAPCGSIGATVWYRWTAGGSGTATISVVNSTTNYDTVLAAYTGSSLTGLTNVACNDDFSGLQSQISITCTAGTTYQIQLGGYKAATGTAKIWIAGCGGSSVPGAPTGLSATAGNGQVSLSWTAPSNGGSAITNYKIYRSTTSGSETSYSQTGGSNTSYVDKKATNGVTYYYKVSAVNSIGEGALSNEASATPTAPTVPGAPTSLTATAGNAQISLSWTAPSSNGGSAITNYKIYRGTTSGSETSYSQTGGSNTSYVDKKAVNGQVYYYKVSAVNSVGEGAKSNEASATPSGTTTYFTDNMESGSSKWTFQQYGGSGTSTWHDYDFSATPSSYHSATHAMECGGGTSYTANTDCGLDTVAIDLSTAKSAYLKFWHKVEGESYSGGLYFDYGTVWASKDGGTTWCQLATDLAGITSWQQKSYSLSGCSGVLGSKDVIIEFEFVSDSSVENGGWFVDDVTVTSS